MLNEFEEDGKSCQAVVSMNKYIIKEALIILSLVSALPKKKCEY